MYITLMNKMINAGERLIVNNCSFGYLSNRIVFYLLNLHIKSRVTYFVRVCLSSDWCDWYTNLNRPVFHSMPIPTKQTRPYPSRAKITRRKWPKQYSNTESRNYRPWETKESLTLYWNLWRCGHQHGSERSRLQNGSTKRAMRFVKGRNWANWIPAFARKWRNSRLDRSIRTK